jgi:WD40 repeat protein
MKTYKALRSQILALAITTAALPGNTTVARGQQEAATGPSVIHSVAFSSDGKLLAAAAERADKKGVLVIFEVASGMPRLVHPEDAGIRAVAFSPQGGILAIAGVSPLVKLLRVDDGDLVKTLEGHENQGRSVAFSRDGNRLITANNDRTARIWDVSEARCLTTFSAHTNMVSSAAITPDGSLAASCGQDRTTRIWNPATGEELRVLKPTEFYAVHHVALSPDGKFLATAHGDALVRIRETRTGLLRARIPTGAARVAFSANSRMLAAMTYGRIEVQVFDIDLSEPPLELQRQIDKLIGRWDDDSFPVRETASAELVKIGMPAESQLRKAMQSESAETRIRARRAHTAVWSPAPRSRLSDPVAEPTSIAFSPTGPTLASGNRAGAITLWDATSGKALATLSVDKAVGK